MAGEFSGTLRIVADCRDDDHVDIQITDGEPDKVVPYERNEDGEECSFDFYIDGDHRDSVNISSSRRMHIAVDEDGEIIYTIDDET